MSNLESTSVSQFVSLVAKSSPVWAGGSVLALSCAHAWALVAMTAGLAHRRSPDDELATMIGRATEVAERLVDLGEQDAHAMRAALRSPTPDTWRGTVEVPLEILALAVEGQRLAGHPLLTRYAPAQFDLKVAQTLFSTASSALRDLVQENARQLPRAGQTEILRRLDELN